MDRGQFEKVVVSLEWEMFQQVKGINGRASCQDNLTTFVIMRTSQFESWDLNVVKSYLSDLLDAKANERNLVMEKYAYMMEETDPEYFARIKHLLPVVSDRARALVYKILGYYEKWVREFAVRYPNIRKNGRAMDVSIPGAAATLMNYLKCELYTYSEKTLELFVESILKDETFNRYWYSMEKMAQAYGYNTLDEAEEDLK
ncbi:MAG: DUF4125 family protein [Eubacterium sp.]|nr:DUF4125 family protein [Eubacterium sp.]